MLVLAGSVLGVVALGPLAVLSSSFGFNLSTVEQCGPVNISFFGISSPSDSVPITLTLLPFDSQPISIPISNFARSSTGVALSFLPLAADTTFVASFDDAAGNGVLRVTDVIRVLPSPTGNSTCLPPASDATPHRFALNGSLSQCQTFDVTYDPTVIAQPPSIRLFSPRGVAASVNRTTRQFVNGTATYTMCAQRGKQVVLAFDDGHNHRETTSLITVGGDSTSDKSCICSKGTAGGDDGSSDAIGSSAKLSKSVIGAIIGIGAGGAGFVGIMAVLMVLYVLRERRRRRSRGVALGDGTFGKETGNEKFGSSISSDFPMYSRSSWDQKSSPLSPTPPVPPPKSPRCMNPPYTDKSLFSPASPDYPRNSLSSFDPVTPNNQLDQTFQNSVGSPEATGRGCDRSYHPSISSADIKTMLDVATMHMDCNGGRILTSPSVPLGRSNSRLSADLVLPTATTRRWPHPARGHLRDPSHSRSLSESLSDSSSIIGAHQPSRPLRVAKRVRPSNGKISTFPTRPNTAQNSSGWFEEV